MGWSSAGGNSATGAALVANNLSDVTAATALSNLGLRRGSATLVDGVKVVNLASVTTNSIIALTTQALGTVVVPTVVAVTARTAGVSFTITSANVVDTSTVGYTVIEP